MPNYTTADIAELREMTSMGLMDVKKALDEADGDKKQALALLAERGASIMAKKSGRHAAEGVIEAYVHAGRIGVLVEVNCETDFVARGETFKEFAHDLALQISSMAPASVEELLGQPFVKDSKLTIAQYLADVTGKLGEKIVISRFDRYTLGELAGEKPAED
ncbi:MAG TPA: translation elongation factor Ts [Verrucomicrobiae bacterium]|nr:translation elongation factor Ts [Verrucomicrobiae bacterium]